jgi:hypothetical protein
MGGFGSRGGLFLMAPVKRSVPSDAPPVRVSKSSRARSGREPSTDQQGTPCWGEYFQTLYTEETTWEESAKPRSEP